MQSEFEMTDLRKLSYFLGLEFVETSEDIIVHQKKYVCDILGWFKMTDCNPAITPTEVNSKLEACKSEEAINQPM